MKLLNSIIILGLIQLLAASSTFKQELLQMYTNEVEILNKEFCENAKALCKNLLQDEIVQKANTPAMKEFKQQLKDFLRYYPSYIRYDLLLDLMIVFNNLIPEPSSNRDRQYIYELMMKEGFEEINDDYESKLMEFVEKQFLPKFEELKLKLTKEELQQQEDFFKWCHKLKQCKEYDCQIKLFNIFTGTARSPKEELYYFLQQQLEYFDILYGNAANDIANSILKDQKLLQLSNAVRQHLIININDYIMNFEVNQDINELNNLVQHFLKNILQKFYYNRAINSKDRRLLMKIFNDNGYVKLLSNYRLIFNDFIQQEVFEKLEEFKSSLTGKELKQERKLIKCFDKLKALNSYIDRFDQFHKCFNILENEIE